MTICVRLRTYHAARGTTLAPGTEAIAPSGQRDLVTGNWPAPTSHSTVAKFYRRLRKRPEFQPWTMVTCSCAL